MSFCMFKCLRCKKSLQRFRPKNVLQGLNSDIKYSCPHCSRRYYTPFILKILHTIIVLFVFVFISIQYLPDDREGNVLDIILVAISISYATGAFSILKPVYMNNKV